MRKLLIMCVVSVFCILATSAHANDWYFEYSNSGTSFQETINEYDSYWVFGEYGRTNVKGVVNNISTSGSLEFSKEFQVDNCPTSCFDAIVGTFEETDNINTGFFVTGEVNISSTKYPYFAFINECGNLISYRIIYDLPNCRGLEIIQAQNGNIVMVVQEIQGHECYLLRHSLTGSSPIWIHAFSEVMMNSDDYMLPAYLIHVPDKLFPDELFVIGGSIFSDISGTTELYSCVLGFSGPFEGWTTSHYGFFLPLTETWIHDGCLSLYGGQPRITTIGQSNINPYDVNVFRQYIIHSPVPGAYMFLAAPPNEIILPGHGIINDISYVHGKFKIVGFADDYSHNKEICFVDMTYEGDTLRTIHHGYSGDSYGFIHGTLIDNGYVVAGYNHIDQKLAICRNDNVWPQSILPLSVNNQNQIENLSFTNPVGDKATISFTTQENGMVKVEVFDMSGRMVDLVIDQSLPSGEHTIIWEPSQNICNGTYFFRITNQNNVSNNQMILIR